MDKKTVNAYSALAQSYSEDWLAQPAPTDMHELLKKYFIPKGKTADIGCGNGRDAGWLADRGFDISGFDSSSELLQIASDLFPTVKFCQAFLPQLDEITEHFENVLCETVIMHLAVSVIPSAIKNLIRILKKGGILYLSWRVTDVKDVRSADGRLYSTFSPETILNCFEKDSILHFENKLSVSSGKNVYRLIYKK